MMETDLNYKMVQVMSKDSCLLALALVVSVILSRRRGQFTRRHLTNSSPEYSVGLK